MTALVVVALRLPAAGAPRPDVDTEVKTLDRVHEPVVVKTTLLDQDGDRSTAHYRMYAATHGSVVPVPYQFDQRGADGELVLTDDGADADFSFGPDDELVFMAKDAGDRMTAAALPPSSDGALEIRVSDRRQDEQAWVYLVHFPGDAPPRSAIRYASFDPVRQEARAADYAVTYSHDRSNFLTGIRIARTAGGTGQSVIERLRMRISPTFHFLFATIHPTFTEESFAVVPDGMKNGPVRAIRRVRQSLDLGKAFPDIPSGRVYTYYYADSFRTPSRFSIPWLALKTLRDFRFESVNSFPGDESVRYWDAENRAGVPIAAGDVPVDADADHDWWVVSSERGTCLHALVIPDEWRAWGIKRGIVVEDRGAGYSLLRMTNLRKAGDYLLGTAMVVLPRPYRPGDEADALADLREPLQADVRRMPLAGDDRRAAR